MPKLVDLDAVLVAIARATNGNQEVRREFERQLTEVTAQGFPRMEVELRPVVVWFAGWMEKKLRENDARKGGWNHEQVSSKALAQHLLEELTELLREVERREEGVDNRFALCEEAADVANIAMMLADRAMGCLFGPRGTGK